MELYRRYGPALRRKCERMLGSRQDAEDIVQELFTDLLRKGLLRKGGADVTLPYLYQAATRRSLNRIRDRRRRQELLDRHGDLLIGGGPGGPEDRVVSLDLLCRLVDRLDRRSAEIVVYRYADRMTGAEIAQVTGISRRAVTARLTRVRAELERLAGETP